MKDFEEDIYDVLNEINGVQMKFDQTEIYSGNYMQEKQCRPDFIGTYHG